MTARVVCGLVVVTCLTAITPAQPQSLPAPAQTRTDAVSQDALTLGELVARTYDAAYNLDHTEALALARRAVALAPEAATSHRTLASVLWQTILFRRGAVSVDHYMKDMAEAQKHLPDPPPDLDREFHAELSTALSLAEAQLEQDDTDVVAQYEVGAAHGLLASYAASVEGSLRAAFGKARSAFNAQEEVLKLDATHPHANAVVGTYRYMISALGLVSRWVAYIAGFGGGKERGISMLEFAAEQPGARAEAGTALMLIYSREGRHRDAYELALELAPLYPRNRLLVLEAGAAAVRAGLGAEAEALLADGLAKLDDDPRPRVPGERAVWLYQRGLARLGQGKPDEAAEDFQAALDGGAVGWHRGRLRTGLGKVLDLAGDREGALAEYAEAQQICDRLDDKICVTEVEQLQRRPFALPEGGGLE